MIRGAEAVTPLPASLKGFIGRDYGKTVEKQGEWVDTVMWSSLKDAFDAAKNVTGNPGFEPFARLIDDTTIQMRHVLIA